MDMNHILVVDDEKAIVDLVVLNLEMSGYECDFALDGEDAIRKIDAGAYDLILLDIMLPKIDGVELMNYIRFLDIPVIFLTAKSAVKDRVAGLKLGAQDYLTKPFEIIELLARVETVLRRAGKTKDRLQIGDVTIDESSMQVTKAGQPVSLTKKEYELLLLFARNQNMALFRETIYERVWDGEYTGDSRTVDLHVQRLRKKLGWQDRLSAVYKVGYRLEVKE